MITAVQPDTLPAFLKIVEETETTLTKLAGFPVKVKLSADVQELSVSALQTAICEHFKVTWANIRSKSRKEDYTIPRSVYCYLCKYYWPKMKDAAIAMHIQRERSTVTDARNAIALQLYKQPHLKQAIEAIKNKLKP